MAAIDTSRLEALSRAYAQAPEMVIAEMASGVFEAGLYLQRETMERTPSGASGGAGLRASWLASEPEILGDQVLGEMGSPLPYAQPVELGTRPHFPPVQPLEDWVRHSGKITLRPGQEPRDVAFAIARKIAAQGTQGHFMMTKALEAGQAQIERIFDGVGRRVVQRLAEGDR